MSESTVWPVASEFLAASVRTATPLLFAALGETIVEQGGVINIGLEGVMISGAFAALVSGSLGITSGFAAAAATGAAVGLVFAFFVTLLRADQIIAGTAITILGLGATASLYRIIYGTEGAALSIPTLHPTAIPFLSRIPVLGPGLFDQPVITYVAYLLVPAIWWWTYRTHTGLALRSIGENPAAARAAGIRPRLYQLAAIACGGALGGLGGGTIVLAQVGTFAEGMTAGRGFIAIAIVALGRWRPIGVALAALAFGAASALQFLFQSLGWHVPYQLLLALPYVTALTAVAVIGRRGRAVAPRSLGATR